MNSKIENACVFAFGHISMVERDEENSFKLKWIGKFSDFEEIKGSRSGSFLAVDSSAYLKVFFYFHP